MAARLKATTKVTKSFDELCQGYYEKNRKIWHNLENERSEVRNVVIAHIEVVTRMKSVRLAHQIFSFFIAKHYLTNHLALSQLQICPIYNALWLLYPPHEIHKLDESLLQDGQDSPSFSV